MVPTAYHEPQWGHIWLEPGILSITCSASAYRYFYGFSFPHTLVTHRCLLHLNLRAQEFLELMRQMRIGISAQSPLANVFDTRGLEQMCVPRKSKKPQNWSFQIGICWNNFMCTEPFNLKSFHRELPPLITASLLPCLTCHQQSQRYLTNYSNQSESYVCFSWELLDIDCAITPSQPKYAIVCNYPFGFLVLHPPLLLVNIPMFILDVLRVAGPQAPLICSWPLTMMLMATLTMTSFCCRSFLRNTSRTRGGCPLALGSDGGFWVQLSSTFRSRKKWLHSPFFWQLWKGSFFRAETIRFADELFTAWNAIQNDAASDAIEQLWIGPLAHP